MMSVRENNMGNPVYKFCYLVAEHILREEADVHNRVTFQRLKRSRAMPTMTIEFGYECVQDVWLHGCGEYKRAAARAGVSTASEPGWVAVHHLVIHSSIHLKFYKLFLVTAQILIN